MKRFGNLARHPCLRGTLRRDPHRSWLEFLNSEASFPSKRISAVNLLRNYRIQLAKDEFQAAIDLRNQAEVGLASGKIPLGFLRNRQHLKQLTQLFQTGDYEPLLNIRRTGNQRLLNSTQSLLSTIKHGSGKGQSASRTLVIGPGNIDSSDLPPAEEITHVVTMNSYNSQIIDNYRKPWISFDRYLNYANGQRFLANPEIFREQGDSRIFFKIAEQERAAVEKFPEMSESGMFALPPTIDGLYLIGTPNVLPLVLCSLISEERTCVSIVGCDLYTAPQSYHSTNFQGRFLQNPLPNAFLMHDPLSQLKILRFLTGSLEIQKSRSFLQVLSLNDTEFAYQVFKHS